MHPFFKFLIASMIFIIIFTSSCTFISYICSSKSLKERNKEYKKRLIYIAVLVGWLGLLTGAAIYLDAALDCVEPDGYGFNYPECPVKIKSYLLYEHIPIISYFYGVWLIFFVLAPIIIPLLMYALLFCFKYKTETKPYDKHNKPIGKYIKTTETRSIGNVIVEKKVTTTQKFLDPLRNVKALCCFVIPVLLFLMLPSIFTVTGSLKVFEVHSKITFDRYEQSNTTSMPFNSTARPTENENYCSKPCYLLTFISLIVFDIFYGLLIIISLTYLIVRRKWPHLFSGEVTSGDLEMK